MRTSSGTDSGSWLNRAPWEVDGIAAGVHELVRALDGAGELSCTGRDGLIVVEMMIACLQSQQQNNAKIALPLPR